MRIAGNRIDLAIAELTRCQHGIIRADQLVSLGLGRSGIDYRLKVGRLRRVHRGVYSVHPGELGPEARWLAAVFAAGEGAVLAGRAAADLWGLSRRPSGLVEIVTPCTPRAPRGVTMHRTRSLPGREVTTRKRIPVTTVSRTLVDLVGMTDPYDVIGMFFEAAYRERLDLRQIRRIARRLKNRGDRAALEFVIRQHDAGSRGVYSQAERFVLQLIEGAGLPRPFVNVPVQTPRGPFLVDMYWSSLGCCVEVDGPGHARTGAQVADRERELGLHDAGKRLLRVPTNLLYADPDEVVRRIERLLRVPD